MHVTLKNPNLCVTKRQRLKRKRGEKKNLLPASSPPSNFPFSSLLRSCAPPTHFPSKQPPILAFAGRRGGRGEKEETVGSLKVDGARMGVEEGGDGWLEPWGEED